MPSWFIKNRPSHPLRALLGPRSPWELPGVVEGREERGACRDLPQLSSEQRWDTGTAQRDRPACQQEQGLSQALFACSLFPLKRFWHRFCPRAGAAALALSRIACGIVGCQERSCARCRRRSCSLLYRIAREVKWLRGHLVTAQELRSRAQVLMLSSWCSLPSLCSDSLGKRKSPWTALLANTKPKNLGSKPMDLLQLAPSVGEKQVF